jgi:DNA-binding IclR family transcriptional regulator
MKSPVRASTSSIGDRKGSSIRAVPAITRGIAILRLLASRREPLGVNAIARELGIVPSTCLHILRALAAEGLVGVEATTKRYALDAGVLTLARSLLRQDGYARASQPEIDQLATRFPVTAIALRVIELKHMIVVAISRSEGAVRLQVDVGSRFPALISATGRCLAAFGGYDERDLEPAFHGLRWDVAPNFETWRAEVAATRRTGYGIDKGSYIRGVTVLAAPVMSGDGRMTHALATVGLTEQLKSGEATVLGQQIKAAADRITRRIGGGNPEERDGE